MTVIGYWCRAVSDIHLTNNNKKKIYNTHTVMNHESEARAVWTEYVNMAA